MSFPPKYLDISSYKKQYHPLWLLLNSNHHIEDENPVINDFPQNILKIYIDPSIAENKKELRETYINAITKHNSDIFTNTFYDSGFDLYCPKKYTIDTNKVNKINFGVSAAMFVAKKPMRLSTAHLVPLNISLRPISYTLYPRSSLSKTNLRLANSVGIIDSGYRGNLIGAFDYKTYTNNTESKNPFEEENDLTILRNRRLVQICHPMLEPFFVKLVNSLEELGITSRDKGGFGSTGK